MKLLRVLFVVLVSYQLLVITLLIKVIVIRSYRVQISPISQNNVLSISSNELAHFYESSPSSMIQYKPDWLAHPVHHTITKDTLNERFEYAIQKPNKVKRIITLGDSFTYGLYVNTEETWSEQLEDLLNNKTPCEDIIKHEVINLGMNGYDARYSAVRFKERGMKYDPDVLIWYIKDDDVEEIRDISYPIVEEFVQQQRSLSANSSKSDVELYEKAYYKAKESVMKEYDASSILDYHRRSIELVTSEFKGTVYIINGFGYSSASKKFLLTMQQMTSNIIVFDKLLAEFDKESITNTPYDSHLNSIGHRKIAEELYAKLAKNNYCSGL